MQNENDGKFNNSFDTSSASIYLLNVIFQFINVENNFEKVKESNKIKTKKKTQLFLFLVVQKKKHSSRVFFISIYLYLRQLSPKAKL